MRTILSAPAWPYANGPRHIGHVSGFALPCDMFSRYQRMAGNRVLMVSGTDEHGTPIQVQADAEGVSARALADRYNRVIVEDLAGLVGLIFSLLYWNGKGFHQLNYEHSLRLIIPSVTALIVSWQVILGTFFLSILGIRHTRHPVTAPSAVVPDGTADHREQSAAAPRL